MNIVELEEFFSRKLLSLYCRKKKLTATQRKYNWLQLLFWVQRDCWWQSDICQYQNNLKSSTPTESINVLLGDPGVQILPVMRGWIVCVDKEKEMYERLYGLL